jgi:PHD/YefM family antitoxin component YafN of YafNO toxin-antitoxin module
MSRREKTNGDVKPVSDFKAVSDIVKEVQRNNRPLILTDNGEAQAVVLTAFEYAQLLDTIDLLNDIIESEREFAEGKGITHEKVKAQLLARFRK